jgi:hypothetical protein
MNENLSFCGDESLWLIIQRKFRYQRTRNYSPPPRMSRQPLVGQGLLIIEASRSLRHTTLARTPLDKWSVRLGDLYLTTRNTHKRQTSVPQTGFEPAIPASERRQTNALDRAATGIGIWQYSAKDKTLIGT